jgi:SulP family sulfate permease
MLVAVPAAIANGLVMYAPLGPQWAGAGALAGMIGAAGLGVLVPVLGGAPRLVSAPSPAACAFMAVVGADLLASGGFRPEDLPARFVLTIVLAGLVQAAFGAVRLGRLVNLLPYPVISGYLTGSGLLILYLQIPRLLGASGSRPWRALASPERWRPEALAVATVTIAAAIVAPRLARRIPATLVGLAAGSAAHALLGTLDPTLLRLDGNALLVGRLPSAAGHGPREIVASFATALSLGSVAWAIVPAVTLAVVLSVDTLKTSLLVDGLTGSRCDPDRELRAHGKANLVAGLLGGAPGTSIVSGSLVNVTSGGRTRRSSVLAGAFALGALLGLSRLLAHLPVAALSAIVSLMAVRMLQGELLRLVRRRATLVDVAVAAAVIVVAMLTNLAVAAAAGVLLSCALFVRDRAHVTRDPGALAAPGRARVVVAIPADGSPRAIAIEGPLTFGTADRLATEIEAHLAGHAGVASFDLSRVKIVDLTGAAALRRVASRLSRRGGRLLLRALPRGPAGPRLVACLSGLRALAPHGAIVLATEDEPGA